MLPGLTLARPADPDCESVADVEENTVEPLDRQPWSRVEAEDEEEGNYLSLVLRKTLRVFKDFSFSVDKLLACRSGGCGFEPRHPRCGT